MRLKRVIALLLAAALFMPLLPGCAATGSDSPEELAERVFDAVLDANGEELMDCMLPSLSAAYRASSQLAAAFGADMEEALAQDMLSRLNTLYGVELERLSQIKNEICVISSESGETTAVVRTLLVIEIDKMFDYVIAYVSCSKMGAKWYLTDLSEREPSGYSPDTERVSPELLSRLTAVMDCRRLEVLYDVPFGMGGEVTVGGEIVTTEMLEATWLQIDKYKERPAAHDFDRYLTTDALLTPFDFDDFVLSYQDMPLMQASVAAVELTDVLFDVLSLSVLTESLLEGVDFSTVGLKGIKDEKVAGVIIDYFASVDVSEGVADVSLDVKTAKKNLTAVKKMLKAEKAVSASSLLSALKKIEVTAADGSAVYKLSDMLELTKDNAEAVARQLAEIAEETTNSSTLRLSLQYDWEAPIKADFYRKLKGSKAGSSLFTSADEHLKAVAKDDAWKKTIQNLDYALNVVSALMNGAEMMREIAVYQEILDRRAEELQKVLEHAGTKDAEHIVSLVMKELTETTAKGFVEVLLLSIDKEGLSMMVSDVKKATKDILGLKTGINPYLLLLEVGSYGAKLLCNADASKKQMWALEDTYDAYLDAMQGLREKMDEFYKDPTAENYEALYYASEYYALLVRAASQKTSGVLVAKGESVISMFTNWVSMKANDSTVDLRLQEIEDAKKIPGKAEEDLDKFLAALFPK